MSHDLYPPPAPAFDSGMLTLDARHTLYWEQTGNPLGQPVLVVHGGPGSGMQTIQQRFFDPRHFRIISYDHRGAGRSLPSGELKSNTSEDLLADMETLRESLEIDRWLLMGGSWGSSLALMYAQRFPATVTGLIVRGVFLCSQKEIDWLFNSIRHVYPEAFREFIEHLPENERQHPLASYASRILSDNPAVAESAALAWCAYEANCSTLLPIEQSQTLTSKDKKDYLALARIQAHYFQQRFFVSGTSILDNTDALGSIPGEIVQGRYDMICPMQAADQLHRVWPTANYTIVANAGHSATEPGIRRALLAAVERFKAGYQPPLLRVHSQKKHANKEYEHEQ